MFPLQYAVCDIEQRGHSSMLCNAGVEEGVKFANKKRYDGVRFKMIVITRGVGVKYPEKKHYVTLEWPANTLTRVE